MRVCVHDSERESEWEQAREKERERKRVCVWERGEGNSKKYHVWGREKEQEREGGVCKQLVYEKKAKDSVSVRVCVCISVCARAIKCK